MRKRFNEAKALCESVRCVNRYLASRPTNTAIFQIDAEPLYQSLLGQFKSRFFNFPRLFARASIRRAQEYNRWVTARIRYDQSGARFVGDGFSIWFPEVEGKDASETFACDLREIVLENRYTSLFPFGRIIPDDGVVLDCGANIGSFAVWVSWKHKNARVFAFEPEPLIFRALCDNIERNGLSDRVRCFECGLSDQPNVCELLGDNRSLTQHRLVNIFEPFAQQEQRKRATHVLQVKCVTIDQMVDELKLDRCDLIKMDIEGSEPSALLGAKQTIKRFRPRLSVASYHRLSDSYVLPLLVREMCPEYNVIVSNGNLFAFV